MTSSAAEIKPERGLSCGLRVALIYVPISLLLMAGLLLFHKIPDGYDRVHCAENWTLTERITIVLNCDSPEYLHLAREPQDLFLPTTNRQSRPGLVLIAALLTRVFPSSYSVSGFLAWVAGHPLDDFTLELFSTYLPYLALNLAFVWISVALFGSLTGCSRGQPMAVLQVGCLLIFNDVVKAFLLSPNTALLAIVAPLFALWCYREIRRGRFARAWHLAVLALAVGMAVTAYALFLVALPMIWWALWLRGRDAGSRGWRAVPVGTIVLTAVLTFLPAAAWYAWVRLATGQFFFSEAANYSEVVWLWEGLRTAPAMALLQLVGNALRLAVMAIRQAIPALALAVLLLAVAIRREIAGLWLRDGAFVPPIVVSLLCLAFFAIAGIMAERRAYSAVPTIVVIVGMMVDRATSEGARWQKLALAAGTGLVVIAQAVILLVKVGPFS
jgi:hypothetical protein